MTADEADQRIILSRHTLARYRAMADAGQWPVQDFKLINDEINLLSAIGVEHVGKANKVMMLYGSWIAFQLALRAKLN